MTSETGTIGILEEKQTHDTGSGTGNGHRVILYNDDWHNADDVAQQVQKATGCSAPEAWTITAEAHYKGRAICYRGEREECHRVTRVLREIRLQCEVDCD